MKWKNGIAFAETKRGRVWKIRYMAPVFPGAPWPRKQKTETLIGCRSRGEAAGVLASRMSRIFDRTYRPDSAPPITVTDGIEQFIAARSGELASISSVRGSLRNHVARLMGKLFMQEATTARWEDYRSSRLNEGAAKATVRNELRYMQMVYTRARKDGHDVGDPISDVSFRGAHALKNARKRVPSPAELANLVTAALKQEPLMRAVFFALACTGMRIGTALKMRWDGLSFEERWIDVVQKGNDPIRVPMSARLAFELELWRPASVKAGGESGWVFPAFRRGKSGVRGALSKTAVYDRWPDLLKEAKVDGLTRHDMRRWVVTALRKIAKGDDKALGAVSGQRGQVTIDRYDQGALERAHELVPHLDDLIPIYDALNVPSVPLNDVDESVTELQSNVARKPG